MLRIGGALLMHTLLFNIGGTVVTILNEIFKDNLTTGIYIALELLMSLVYITAFVFPAYFFYLISRKRNPLPPMLEPHLGSDFPLMLFATIALSLAAAYLNASIVNIVGFYDYYGGYSEDLSSNISLLLVFISTAVVPAFSEELLFRGVILTNLKPYGKTTALLASAALFALMHNNGAQLLYTFIAGIFIGLVYIKTRSLWGCILIHFFNNLISVIELLLDSRLGERANLPIRIIELTVFTLGIVSLIILVIREKKKKRDFSSSGFGVILPPDENYIEKPITAKQAVRGFFSPTVIVFLCLSAITIVLTLFRAAMANAGLY